MSRTEGRPTITPWSTPRSSTAADPRVQLVEIRRMLATTGVERPDGDTATWLWAVLDEHATSGAAPRACPTCGTVPLVTSEVTRSEAPPHRRASGA